MLGNLQKKAIDRSLETRPMPYFKSSTFLFSSIVCNYSISDLFIYFFTFLFWEQYYHCWTNVEWKRFSSLQCNLRMRIWPICPFCCELAVCCDMTRTEISAYSPISSLSLACFSNCMQTLCKQSSLSDEHQILGVSHCDHAYAVFCHKCFTLRKCHVLLT